MLIYESKYGNGKERLMYLENFLKKIGYSVQIISVHEAKPQSLSVSDLYIFSAPNMFGKVVRSNEKISG